MTLAIRMGEVGIIVALEDAGRAQHTCSTYLDEVAGRKLHPVQFDELYARVFYQLSLVHGGGKYITFQTADETQPARTQVLGGGYTQEWSQEEFSKVLQLCVSEWVDANSNEIEWFVPPNRVPSWMMDSTGAVDIRSLADWKPGQH